MNSHTPSCQEQYTGRERRFSSNRELWDWTDRHDQMANQVAVKEGRNAAVLERLMQRARKRHRKEEGDALFSGWYELGKIVEERRKRVAAQCAPWFGEEKQ